MGPGPCLLGKHHQRRIPVLGWTSGNNANGYWVEDPVSHIRQWGAVNTDINEGTLGVLFPKAFSDAGSISVTVSTRSGADRITYDGETDVSASGGFTIANNGSAGYAYWQADGY